MLQELQYTNRLFQFKQGLDERLLTDDKCKMLFKSKYDGEYIFAFDNVADIKLIEKKLRLIRKHTDARLKFYTLCAYDRSGCYDDDFWKQDILDLWRRIELLAEYKALPYVMRYAKYAESEYKGTYINMASWCNQPGLFRSLSYREFCERKAKGNEKISTLRYFRKEEKELTNINRYYDWKYSKSESAVR